MDRQTTLDQLEQLLPLAAQWAADQERRVLCEGVPLSKIELADAKAIGVRNPERVRLLRVDAVPVPVHPMLKAAAASINFITAAPRGLINPADNQPSAPFLYTRSDADGSLFEQQRNLTRRSYGLDGGGSIASDAAGHVYAAWHALPVGGRNGEDHRLVWVARSDDNLIAAGASVVCT